MASVLSDFDNFDVRRLLQKSMKDKSLQRHLTFDLFFYVSFLIRLV